MSCKISIIVPHYKTELYIHKGVESIISQTLKEFELILVNDGSPDRCGEICDEYAKSDSRIKVIHKQNGGYSSAINAALDIAQGEYIGIVDGDDYIDKDMYKDMYKLAKEYDADIVECNTYIDRNNIIRPVGEDEGLLVGDNLFALDRLIRLGWNNVLWNKIYKRSLFHELRLPLGKRYSDSFVVYKLLFMSQKYVYTSECRYFYLERVGSVTSENEYSIKKLEGLECHEERYNYLKARIEDESIVNLTEYHYFNEVLYHYHCLSINKQLDSDKEYRKTIREHILINYDGFKRNPLLKKYRIWLALVKLNGTLFESLYNLYLPIHKRYYNFQCKCKIFIRRHFMKPLNSH